MTAPEAVSATSAVRRGLWFSVVLCAIIPIVCCQVTWTPIYISGHSLVDLWTQSPTGCSCSFNSSSNDCACCVPSGGCNCGVEWPQRCAQCGLEQYCANMCNMTLDSKHLFSKSDRGYGQIKSPSFEGPTSCTYRFVPDTGQRVELQIHRLISIGRHNGSSCAGGWLQFEGGAKVCGLNERFSRPVVLFSDKPTAILHMQITERTERSQFLAYFSFASKTSTSVGWPVRGGKLVNSTECDWIYKDTDCRGINCILASPGYPGLYPPNSRCRYHIISSPRISVTINFSAVLLPHNHCATDYIAVYAGSTTSSPLLQMICVNGKESVVHAGPNILVEFRSGPEVLPFDYNGFVASLNFEVIVETPTTVAVETTSKTLEMIRSAGKIHNTRYNDRLDHLGLQHHEHRKDQGSTSCDVEVSGDKVRSGRYDTRGKDLATTCRLILRGHPYDTVHVSVTSYYLSAYQCKSFVEIYDGFGEEALTSGTGRRSLNRICSPKTRYSDSALFNWGPKSKSSKKPEQSEPERYSSTGPNMTVVLRRSIDSLKDDEHVEVSYYFHNERESGTQQPKSICDVEYYGLSSPHEGRVIHPEPYRLVSVGGPVKCRMHFIPAVNQSIIITVENSTEQMLETQCSTKCGDGGCHCDGVKPLKDTDYLLLVSETGHPITCLCGNYKEWLPVSIRSWTPVYIEWSRSFNAGINFMASYKFETDPYCGSHTTTKPEGEVNGGDLARALKLNQYYQQKCTWVLDSLTDRQLTIEIESKQDRPCSAWNMTIHEYIKSNDTIGERVLTFCSRDKYKNFTLEWKKNTAVVKLHAFSRTAPQYTMRWRSDSVTANTRKSGPSPAPNHVTGSSSSIETVLPMIFAIVPIFLLCL